MQLSKLLNTDKPNMKYVWFMFLPILAVILIQYGVVIGDMLILFVKNLFSDRELPEGATVEYVLNSDYNQPMNLAYLTLVQYLIYILLFGIWYYRAFCKEKAISDISSGLLYIKDKLLTIKTICLIVGGYFAQLFVDGILTLVEPYFTDLFANYGKMVDSITGVGSSWVMLFAVIFVAPIGEELLFRGLIQSYGLKNFAPGVAIFLQGLIFGLYHGNIIQGIYACLMGVILGFVAYKLKSIIYPMILHISINASLLLVPEVLYDGTVKTAITTAVTGVGFAVMIWLSMRKRDKLEK
ncbi:MAG: CPBP family intramembrane metalloprotease [Lachnospiraceae bacterium]|nr:CPBP family intramembrane metalloprotease [Lachnospiraceae bacterium]